MLVQNERMPLNTGNWKPGLLVGFLFASEYLFLGEALAILAGIAWGATTVVIRTSSLSGASPRATLLYQLVMAVLILSIAALATQQLDLRPTTIALSSIAFQSVFVACLGFLTWFWLLRNYHASPIGIMSFMTPIFGVLLGAWLLSEPLEPGFLVGSALVIAGVVLVSSERWIRQAFANLS